jgi:CheY-like chemotaxis protein
MPWILYVEDDPDDIEVFNDMLNDIQPQIECVAVMHPTEVIGIITTREPALCVYLDMNLPGMTGLEVLEQLRGHTTYDAVPVFILSTSKNNYAVKEAFALGATDYLVKPTTSAEFRQLLKSCFLQHFED